MKISDIFSQFKTINPDPHYTEHSKRVVLASPQLSGASARVQGIGIFLRVLETGVALVLAGFFIMLATGAFSGTPLEPVQYSVIDPSGLRAEAKAISIQIQLANLNYSETTSTAAASGVAESTTSVSSPVMNDSLSASAVSASGAVASSSSTASGTASSASTSSAPLTVNQALQALSH